MCKYNMWINTSVKQAACFLQEDLSKDHKNTVKSVFTKVSPDNINTVKFRQQRLLLLSDVAAVSSRYVLRVAIFMEPLLSSNFDMGPFE